MNAQLHERASGGQGFAPGAIEVPGGGRITNKKDPSPHELVHVTGYGARKVPLHRAAAAALQAMIAAARAAGIAAPLLQPISGYRSTARQRGLFAAAVRRYGSEQAARKWVAKPGGSAHHSGRAVDVYLGYRISSGNATNMRKTPAWRWLRENAVRFGFYPYEAEPWHWEYNPPATGIASAEMEEAPARAPAAGVSRLLPLSWGTRWPSSAGLYVPRAAKGANALDLVVYFHGHIIPACRTDPASFLKDGMAYYWGTPYFRCLRSEVEKSGRALVLVAPTLAPIFGRRDSGNAVMGNFQDAGQLDRLVDEAMEDLRSSGAITRSARVARIVLAGHSAGGKPMQAILGASNRVGSLVQQCWGFECLYFGTAGWRKWLLEDAPRRFIHFRRDATMQSAAHALSHMRNFADRRGGKSHCRIVEQFWGEAVRGLDRSAPRTGSAEQEAFLPQSFDLSKLKGLMGGTEYVPKTGAPASKAGIQSKVEVLGYKDHDATFAPGTLLHRRVSEVSKATGMDPGFLAANLVAESGPSTWSKTSGVVASEVLGLDDWFDPVTARYIKAAIAAAPALGFRYSDVRATGESWDTSTEKAGGALKPRGVLDATKAVAALAMYMKVQELMMQRIIENNRKEHPYLLNSIYDLPPEKRFTLQRYMFNAGIGSAFKFFKELSRGADIPRTGGITRDPKNPRRTAVLHMARAIHLGQAVFGKPPLAYRAPPDR